MQGFLNSDLITPCTETYGSIDINNREWQTCLQRQSLRPREREPPGAEGPASLGTHMIEDPGLGRHSRHLQQVRAYRSQREGEGEPRREREREKEVEGGEGECVCLCAARGRGRGTERGDAATHLSPQFAEHHAVRTDKSPVPRNIPQEGPLSSPIKESRWPAQANFRKGNCISAEKAARAPLRSALTD